MTRMSGVSALYRHRMGDRMRNRVWRMTMWLVVRFLRDNTCGYPAQMLMMLGYIGGQWYLYRRKVRRGNRCCCYDGSCVLWSGLLHHEWLLNLLHRLHRLDWLWNRNRLLLRSRRLRSRY